MRISCISDTHCKHNEIDIKEFENIDCIISAGDISSRGYSWEIENFLSWFDSLPCKYKILVAGNHDFYFQDNPEAAKILLQKYSSIIYLENSAIQIEGINIYGSPIQPTFFNWAFNVDRGLPIKRYWDMIPNNTDILITHGPAFGHGDFVRNSINVGNVGCVDLLYTIEKIKPKYFICGHIHSGYGITTNEHTTFINAAVLNEAYQMQNKPINFEYQTNNL